MRLPFFPRPARHELALLPLHEIARDFPEALPIIRAHGLVAEDLGGRTARDVLEGEDLLDRIHSSTAWRPDPSRS